MCHVSHQPEVLSQLESASDDGESTVSAQREPLDAARDRIHSLLDEAFSLVTPHYRCVVLGFMYAFQVLFPTGCG